MEKSHNLSKTKEFNTWQQMKGRCYNINSPKYKDYGGRGITVCDRWKNSFENFLADMGLCPEDLSLDRLDNELGYYKENCEWRTQKEQTRNTRKNLKVTFKGETKLLIEFCEELGLSYNMVYKRIKERNWTVEDALTNIKITKRKSKIPTKFINFNNNDKSTY